jgi:hypothetical protein
VLSSFDAPTAHIFPKLVPQQKRSASGDVGRAFADFDRPLRPRRSEGCCRSVARGSIATSTSLGRLNKFVNGDYLLDDLTHPRRLKARVHHLIDDDVTKTLVAPGTRQNFSGETL